LICTEKATPYILNRYVTELAEGGEWPESSEYNQGTVTLLITGALGLKDLTGTDYFPEVTAFIPDLAKRQIMMGTNDLLNTIQWSDEEHPRNTIPGRLFYWERINMMLAGITKGTPIGPAMQDLVLDLVEKYPPSGDVDNALAQRWLYFYDPYAPRGDRTSLEKTWYASGVRMMLSRDGWGPDDSIFMAHYPTKYIVHHNVFYFGNFQLYRNQEWALTHPIAYSSRLAIGPDGVNNMAFMDFPNVARFEGFKEFKNVVEQEFGSDYAYIVGTEAGQIYDSGAWNPPPTFLHEWTRSMLYIQSNDKKSDTIVIFDRTNAEDPRDLPGYPNSYHIKLQTAFENAWARKYAVFHMPMPPSLQPNEITWNTAQSQIKLNTLLPPNQRRQVVDETATWGAADAPASEKKWQVKIAPQFDQDWDTFLNVISVHDTGTMVQNTLVTSAGGLAEGALIERANHNNVLVMFNSKLGSLQLKIYCSKFI
jgi:hypothetical protein